ncbi:putative Nucleoplasmin-like domain [Monocercomonoides exilis]|uniref:putative Nucleoplasmin-like domain n=1 Tax=Monocercomonoides exilis TaxID=2049356 RepID=UPI00355A5C3B|nr:putative Nucleoplasmin-like domain [Monocercomonoides exilis]|eukprot:MONOS_4060.1-p1 / transcript=MONOS_4060.1 / gene=MONOS_4060 / organism=Monocercomonoides_exilis_PA203 / gene_product=unspecified product / transcript_product=unspecified product / location=Mono_scaffold00103:55705-56254(-) / protein_length=144 / sequence_SO=supercontig / SO=protein_coding / is_pseudo=false
MSLFGVIIQSNSRYKLTVPTFSCLHITSVCVVKCLESPTTLYYERILGPTVERIVLCELQKGKNSQHVLNLEFKSRETVQFSSEGDSDISVTGYWTSHNDPLSMTLFPNPFNESLDGTELGLDLDDDEDEEDDDFKNLFLVDE